MELYLMRAGDRTEQVLVLGTEFAHGFSTMSPLQNPRYARAVRELVFTLRFANLPEPRVPRPGLGTEGVVGLWTGLAMSFGRIRPHVAVLFDDGTAYFGPNPPARGLLGIDPGVEAPAAPRSWGAWEMTGGSGRLRLPWGDVPVRTDGAALELTTSGTPHRYVRWTTPRTSALEGDWCLSGGECLRLSPGGRFEDGGAVRVLEHATYAVPESPAGGRGAFELRDHTLVLRYDGGPEIRVAALGVPAGDTGPPGELMLGFNLDVLARR
jgi:hypothetical protein